jgi:crotonobetainyl-CoA:carnitine CoA-transferase CaiB-like acyl-CoA transferase
MGGLMSITGEPDESPGGGPQKVGVAVVDLMTGLYATSAILAALLARASTGHGTHIDLSLLDVQVAALANQASSWLVAHVCPSRLGSAHPSIAPYQPFACADGHVMLAIGNDAQFAAFCRAAECAHLASDPRFSTNAARVQHRHELLTQLEPAMRRKSCDEWTTLGDHFSFPCGPIHTIDQVFEHSQVRARGLVAELNGNRYGSVKSVVSPMRFDGRPAFSVIPPPELGDSTEAVLHSCGYSSQQIVQLREHGVI